MMGLTYQEVITRVPAIAEKIRLRASDYPADSRVVFEIKPLEEALHIGARAEGHDPLVDYLRIRWIDIESGFFWDKLNVWTLDRIYILKGLGTEMARNLRASILCHIQEAIRKSLTEKGLFSPQPAQRLAKLLAENRFASRTDLHVWLNSLPNIFTELNHTYFDQSCFPSGLGEPVRQVCRVVFEQRRQLRRVPTPKDGSTSQGQIPKPGLSPVGHKVSPDISRINEAYINKEIESCATLFSRLEKYPLTEEQMRAAIIDEDCNLLIAAAGSGKSSTIVAKAVYLLHRGLAKPEEILVLAYNKDAQVDIDRRLTAQKGVVPAFDGSVTAKTFHGLGMEIIAQVEGKKPNTSELAAAGRAQQLRLFSQMVKDLRQRDPEFAKNWQSFNLYARYSIPDLFAFANRQEYETYLRDMGILLKYSPEGRRPAILTMDGREVKSMEEVAICNWLTTHGVRYSYERSYPEETATEDHRQYFPDFYYPEIDTYHEHFALNANGQSPICFGGDYLEGVRWKRKFHRERNNSFFETTSAAFWKGSLFDHLEENLSKHGLVIQALPDDEIDQLIAKSQEVDDILELFIGVLQHVKANNASIAWLRKRARSEPEKFRTNLFISLFEPFYDEYGRQLGEDIDFQDQINQASDYLEEGSFQHPYKYVLVDEAQDMSQDRKRMISALLGQREGIKLFAVGDDWQSIYRFSGADIDIMTNFPEHFGYTATNYLTETFRSYQGLVDVAATFVQKNPAQFKKTVQAHADLPGEQVIVDGYTSDHDMKRLLEFRLEQIDRLAFKREQRLSVFILGRYNRLKPPGLSRYAENYPHIDIAFRSIHASKGLEADYVILSGVTSGRYGFPSRVTDDPLIRLVIPKPESFAYAEERRLMYVAITRAKRAAFILSDKTRTSPFVRELLDIPGVKNGEASQRENPCPRCKTGELRKRSGPHSTFLGCSNYPDCKHTEDLICPQCGDSLVGRRLAHGPFLGCQSYPACNYKRGVKKC